MDDTTEKSERGEICKERGVLTSVKEIAENREHGFV